MSAATEAVIIDPGAEPERILAALEELGVSLAGILLTHTHFDHVGAVAPLARASGAPDELVGPQGAVPAGLRYGSPDDVKVIGLKKRSGIIAVTESFDETGTYYGLIGRNTPIRCSITGAAPTQTLVCTAVTLEPGQSETVHVVSATTFASCADYPNVASLTATNAPSLQATATTNASARRTA